ncbi:MULTISPECIES: hypothetical protein [Herbaspirillum]|jgi:hypothetical protein|uniref:Uncharacterized protein n=3 Tax=root TaxID=1 RepID=A0AAJ2LSF2_9BURK|nr:MULTISPECIES: hypothetical protein [Herbaspirillum]MDR9837094.1 hypothetical protein [Herbaspirillum huttiense]
MIYIEDLQDDIQEVLEIKADVAADKASEDKLYDAVSDLGKRLGSGYFECVDYNTFVPRQGARREFGALGTVTGSELDPKLVIEDPDDPENPLIVAIANPTKQYPEG